MGKQRIDIWLVEAGHFASREQAQRAIMAGEVTVDGKRVEKASQLMTEPREVTLANSGPQFVSRGAHKLEKAIFVFKVELKDRICLDAGASTGGFTDYMLQSGAKKVYAIDVGYGQLAWKLRQDPRVLVFERQNIRHFDAKNLNENPTLITADLSFISLKIVFSKFKELIDSSGELITLIKPQFEAGRENVGKKGVVRDKKVHLEVIQKLIEFAPDSGWFLANLTFSPLLGPEGNIEYLGYWKQQPESGIDLTNKTESVVNDAWESLKDSSESK